MAAFSIGVVGSVNLDLVFNAPRLPRPGETVGHSTFARHPGGKGANQALAARRLGHDVALVARVGKDQAADDALELLRADGVDLSRSWRDPVAPTGTACVVVDEEGENQIVVAPGANAHLGPGDVNVSDIDVVICQLEVPISAVAEAARQTTGLFVLNASPAFEIPGEILHRADLIVANELEQAALTDRLVDFEGLVAVTAGGSGARLFRRGREVAHAAAPPVKVVDTTGAGDAFCAALVVGLMEERPTTVALDRACMAGGLAATKPGAQPSLPFLEDLERATV